MVKFDRFTELAQDSAARAYEILQRYGHNQVDTEHLLLALLEQPNGFITQILVKIGVDQESIRYKLDEVLKANPSAKHNIYGGGQGQVFITPRAKRVIDLAQEESNHLKDEYIGTEHIFLGILREQRTDTSRILQDAGITRELVIDTVRDMRGGQRNVNPQAETDNELIQKYVKQYATEALEGIPTTYRVTDATRIVHILNRHNRNSVLLIATVDVGTLDTIQALQRQIEIGIVPDYLRGKEIWSLDLTTLITSDITVERLASVMRAVLTTANLKTSNVLLVIEHIHLAFRSSIKEFLVSALQTGAIQCIGTTTPDKYRQLIEPDHDLMQRFEPVILKEPSLQETISILKAKARQMASQYDLFITDEAIEAAVKLSRERIRDRQFPAKAIDLLDAAAAYIRVSIDPMPPDLRTMKQQLDKLEAAEEAAGIARDYERAADFKVKRLDLEVAYEKRRNEWQLVIALQKYVDASAVEYIISQWSDETSTQVDDTEQKQNSPTAQLTPTDNKGLIRQSSELRIFVSYSRRNKEFVEKLVSRLNTKFRVWWDQRLIAAEVWWTTILSEIEICDCFVAVLTQPYTESPYCLAELDYATAIGKRLLPIVLDRTIKLPPHIGRVQAAFIDGYNSAEAAGEIMLGLMNLPIDASHLQNHIDRPSEPTANDEAQASDIYADAVEAEAAGNLSLSERFYTQVIAVDPNGLGIAAMDGLNSIRKSRSCRGIYENIVRLSGKPETLKGAMTLWAAYKKNCGTEYDPNHFADDVRFNRD